MESTVDDFLNEINEIAPLVQKDHDWQECYDELSGYYYYWNQKTDEVTWSKPKKFKSFKEAEQDKSTLHKRSVNIPPRVGPLFPSTSQVQTPQSVTIYKIDRNSSAKKEHKPNLKDSNKPKNKERVKSSDSEDERIVLISSYGEGSDTDESDKEQISKNSQEKLVDNKTISQVSEDEDDDDDDIDILTKIRQRAKELNQQKSNPVKSTSDTDVTSTKRKDPTGFSLIAGYSDSESEQEDENKLVFPQTNVVQEHKISHSTLFPITQPIDVNDFLVTASNDRTNVQNAESSDFDSKAFQRKRRIGVALVNTAKKSREDTNEGVEEPDSTERKGFGYSNKDSSSKSYSGFTKGGVLFVKADVLNQKTEEQSNSSELTSTNSNDVVERDQVQDSYETLKEKLLFLSEGRSPVSPVQVMMIQAQTLFEAMQEGSLKLSYIDNWLKETCSELIKLEKEATPEGWLLQWDRLHKRYYYQNQTSGESQWEYPQPDVVRCDEAMDICTTPPPGGSESSIHLSPPLPPTISSPSPPPPPVISKTIEGGKISEQTDSSKVDENSEPLPPGVDSTELKSKEKTSGNLDNVLDSFYSDIAAIESTTNSPPPPPALDEIKLDNNIDIQNQDLKKKKKTKVKLTQGLSMKKKGVSKLVEKWKNVQMNYDD